MDENFYYIFFQVPEIIWIIDYTKDSTEVTAIFKNMQTLKFKTFTKSTRFLLPSIIIK